MKIRKGDYGYIRREKKKRLLVTLGLFVLPAIVFIVGLVLAARPCQHQGSGSVLSSDLSWFLPLLFDVFSNFFEVFPDLLLIAIRSKMKETAS